MSEKKLTQVDRVTYSETVKINIGDYESRDVFLSYASDVQADETVDEAISRVKNVVLQQVKKTEMVIRKKAAKFVDFDTRAKLKSR